MIDNYTIIKQAEKWTDRNNKENLQNDKKRIFNFQRRHLIYKR